MIKQRSINSLVRATGVGLHSGQRVEITLRPAQPDTGIFFRRVDLPEPVSFRVEPHLVSDTRLCSALESQGARVATVEHLMSALAGLGIDNIYIDIDASEMPIMDGSAAPFVFLLQSAGIEEQNAPRRFIRLKKTVKVEEGDKWAEISPYEGFRMTFRIAFEHPVLQRSSNEISIDFAETSYVKEISRARTFGFMNEVEYMRANGLGRGGSLDNAIVLGDFHVLNADGLRYADEFVKHKVLDAVGDFYLAGHPLLGAISAYKSGHGLNNKLLRAVMEDGDAWEWATFTDPAKTPQALLKLSAYPAF